MPGMKTWVPGEEALAADMQGFIQTQVVAVFTTDAQRSAQWPTPPDGACSITLDNGRLEVRRGGAWTSLIVTGLSSAGAITAAGDITADGGAGNYARVQVPGAHAGAGLDVSSTTGLHTWANRALLVQHNNVGTAPGIGFHDVDRAAAACFQYFNGEFTCNDGSDTAYIAIRASAFPVGSSARYKHDIGPVNTDAALDAALAVDVVTYKRNPPDNATDDEDANTPLTVDDTTRYGVIAEQVEPILPGLVYRDVDGAPDAVDYGSLAAVAIAALQALTARVAALEGSAP